MPRDSADIPLKAIHDEIQVLNNVTSTELEVAPVVYVVDGDSAVRETLESLIRAAKWEPRMFASAREFLDRRRELIPGCGILDARSPDLSESELRRSIAERPEMPIICIASEGDVPMSVKAMKAGAVEFITKPFRADFMRSAIVAAIEQSRAAVSCEVKLQELRARYASLTYRERQVLHLVEKGMVNKLIAFHLGISVVTAKAHRAKVMRKMRVQCLPDLIRMTVTLGVGHGTMDGIHADGLPSVHAIGGSSRSILTRLNS